MPAVGVSPSVFNLSPKMSRLCPRRIPPPLLLRHAVEAEEYKYVGRGSTPNRGEGGEAEAAEQARSRAAASRVGRSEKG